MTNAPISLAPELKRGHVFADALYLLAVLLTCVWVWSMPLFPSQDGPLHLYYVNALRQLLHHQPGPYLEAYRIKGYVTPYSVYYYSLIGLGQFTSLENADKIMICAYLALFATATRLLLRSVTRDAIFAPFCVLPVLLNWPLMMGFVNYSLSTCLACFALAAWCAGIGRTTLRHRIVFLLLIALMMVTHPVPWLIVLGFVWFEIAVRFLHATAVQHRRLDETAQRVLWLDLTTAVLAFLPYFYISHFKGMVQTVEPEGVPVTPLAHRLPAALAPFAERAQQFLRTLGVDIFAGNELLPRLYRVAIGALLFALLMTAVVYLVRRRGDGTWPVGQTWLLFSLVFLPFLLFLPDKISDHYYFVSRLGILFFVSCIVGGSLAMQRMRGMGLALAAFSFLLFLFTLGLAVRYITPVARTIASLREAPAVSGGRPGLLMQSVDAQRAHGLDYLPYLWAGAGYFRQHNLLLYNTAWLGDPIILVGARANKIGALDGTYYEGVPRRPSQIFADDAAEAEILGKTGFAVIMRQGAPAAQNPLASVPDSPTPGLYAEGWRCVHGKPYAWSICQAPAAPLPAAVREPAAPSAGGI